MSDRYGVLLPLRLETRFIPPGTSATRPFEEDLSPEAATWRLRLRVMPDEVSIDQHEPTPSAAELEHVQALWGTIRFDLMPTDAEERLVAAREHPGWFDAFARLAAATSPARAAWLLANVDVTTAADGRPVASWSAGDLVDASHAKIVGLPAKLDVWVVWKGAGSAGPGAPLAAPEVVGTLRPKAVVDSLALDGLATGGDDGPPAGDGGEPPPPWWRSWDAAESAGLAVEIALARDPQDIAVLGVSGLGPADGATPGQLFRAHAAAGRFSVLRPGVPTSSAFGATTVDTDALRFWASPRTDAAAQGVVRALTGAGDIGPFATDELLGAHQRLSRTIMAACFPALWGYGLAGVLNLSRDPREIGEVWHWALGRLRPEGPHPPVRVGDQVYAVLPLTVPADDVAEGLRARPTTSWRDLEPIRGMLGRTVRPWAAAASRGVASQRGVVGTAAGIRHGPVPHRLGWRQAVPVLFDAVANGADPERVLEQWSSANPAVAAVLGQSGWREFGRAYREAGPVRAFTLPLIGPGLDVPDDQVPDVDDLLAWLQLRLPEPVDVDGMQVWLPRFTEDRPTVGKSLLLVLYLRSQYVAGQLLQLCAVGQVPPPGFRLELLEPLVPIHETRAFHQCNQFINAPAGGCDKLTMAAARASIWDIEDLLVTCADDPRLRPVAVLALRATIDAASGRWDPWLVGVGAAHADDALADGATPTLGAYGWVDAPCRGTPGPGPGGFILAPSQAQAATLAVLRNRAVHDREPARYAMQRSSRSVGAARRWLADVATGWHPAELAGRLLERQVHDDADLPVDDRKALLKEMRAAAPLVDGQGGFGCTHGFDAIAKVRNGEPFPWSHPTVQAAAEKVDEIIGTAGDLLLAEGVHAFLTSQPQRAAAAMQALAGKAVAPRLSVLDATWPSIAVETTVLLAVPPAAEQALVGPAAKAAPAIEAALRSVHPEPLSWQVEVHGQRFVVEATTLRLGHLDAATLDEGALEAVIGLAVAAKLARPVRGEPGTPSDVTVLRDWCRRLQGRPADVTDLSPEAPPAADMRAVTERDAAARSKATTRLLARVRSALRAAERLTSALDVFVEQRLAAEATRLEAAVQALDQATGSQATGPGAAVIDDLPREALQPSVRRRLARLAVRTAAWGFAPPDCAADLLHEPDPANEPAAGSNPHAKAQRAASDLTAYLATCADQLRARIHKARSVPLVAAFLAGTATGGESGHAGIVATTLAELVGRQRLPLGARLTAPSGLGLRAPTGPAEEAAIAEWASTIAIVRPHLAGVVSRSPRGLGLHASDVSDPWRKTAIAAVRSRGPGDPLPPLPRLTVVLSPVTPAASGQLEWIALDSFSESVPDETPFVGAGFDVATPSASPPQAILITPAPVPGSGGPTDEELASLVCYARALARMRMAGRSDLARDGLGHLAMWAALPQDRRSGAPLDESRARETPTWDLPAFLIPQHDDTGDVVTAVTGDPLWLLGAQWRGGEHLGEDAATPLWLESRLTHTPIGASSSRPARDPRSVPFEACLEGDVEESDRYAVPAAAPAPAGTNWLDPELRYSGKFPTGEGGLTRLEVADHNGGPVQWWATVASGQPLAIALPPQGTRQGAEPPTVKLRPGRLDWPGQPRGRYSQIEDHRRDPAGKGPDLTQPATLHLIDALTQHGEDIFVTALPAKAGTVLRPGPVEMVDAAGGRWRLRAPPDWFMMRVEGLDPEPPEKPEDDPQNRWQPALPILLEAEAAMAGPPIDDVAIAVDEDDNLVWAAELLVEGERPVDEREAEALGTLAPADDAAEPPAWDWELGGRVPRHRHPYLHGTAIEGQAEGAQEDRFVRARLMDPTAADGFAPEPGSTMLANTTSLEPLAVPASGVRVLRQPMLARAVDGSPVLWLRRSVRPLDAQVDVDLRWDILKRR